MAPALLEATDDDNRIPSAEGEVLGVELALQIHASLADMVIAPGWSPEEVGSIPTGGTKLKIVDIA